MEKTQLHAPSSSQSDLEVAVGVISELCLAQVGMRLNLCPRLAQCNFEHRFDSSPIHNWQRQESYRHRRKRTLGKGSEVFVRKNDGQAGRRRRGKEGRKKRVESLGWLAESTIMPKKHKAIEGVGASSILELKLGSMDEQ